MGRNVFRWVLVTVCIVGGASAAWAADSATTSPADPPADPSATARAVIEKVTAQALGVLRNRSLSVGQKRERVKQIAYDHIDFEVMARLSLGRYLHGLTAEQRRQYEQDFKQYVTNTYGHTTDNYTDEDVSVYGERKEADGDMTVRTRLSGTVNGTANQEVAKVDYRLRQQGGEWKVIDFTIEGVSLVSNFRSQFEEIMNDGGIDRLLGLLRDKNAANEAAISTPK